MTITRHAPTKRRPKRDPVTPELREAVLRRDGSCLMAQFDPRHVCRDRWSVPHAAWAVNMLTIEHVHDGYGMTGRRAASDMAHCVALCWSANVGMPSSEARTFFREYLKRVAGPPLAGG